MTVVFAVATALPWIQQSGRMADSQHVLVQDCGALRACTTAPLKKNINVHHSGRDPMKRYLSGWKSACIFLLYPALAQPLTLNPVNTWGGIFAGQINDFEVSVSGAQNSYALLTWKLELKGRTLSAGEEDLRFTGSDTATVSLPLKAPPMKSGISLGADLIIELVNDHAAIDRERREFRLRLSGPDALLSDIDRFKELDIQLFDPHGTTSKLFDHLKIPYTALPESRFGASEGTGLIVVGTGVSFDRHRGLMSALIERAGAGRRILVLEPAAGEFTVPGASANDRHRATAISFSNDAIVPAFAPGYRWVSGTSGDRYHLTLRSHRQAVLAEIVGPDKDGWDWVDISYGHSGGGFTVCMLPFNQHIYQGPVPQIILGHLLLYAGGRVTH